jgi:DNA-binding transcriptional ArsR family regulator
MADTRKTHQPLQLFNLAPGRRALPVLEGHDCVVALRALAEETRVRIIGLLIDQPLEVGEISKRLGVSQYNVSKHLRILREAGLLEVEKDGRRHLYALPDALRRRAAEGNILDLGCCSFQFDATSTARQPETPAQRKRPARSPVRVPR